MILLTVDEIIMLHDKLLATTGDLPGLRDRGLLESAVFSMNASFDDVEQYPTMEEKAARLAYAQSVIMPLQMAISGWVFLLCS